MKMKRTLTVATFAFVALLLAGCAGSEPQSRSEPTSPPLTIDRPGYGPVDEYLNSFDARHLNGVDLPRGIVVERARVAPDIEERYVAAVRKDPNSAVAASVFDLLDDDAVLYLGYVYCAGRDVDLPVDRAVASVVDVVARAGGRDPTTPANDDFIAAVTIVNLSSGSLCPLLYVETRAFLDELTSGS